MRVDAAWAKNRNEYYYACDERRRRAKHAKSLFPAGVASEETRHAEELPRKLCRTENPFKIKSHPRGRKTLFTILSHFKRWHISCRCAQALSFANAGTYQKVFLFSLIFNQKTPLALVCLLQLNSHTEQNSSCELRRTGLSSDETLQVSFFVHLCASSHSWLEMRKSQSWIKDVNVFQAERNKSFTK